MARDWEAREEQGVGCKVDSSDAKMRIKLTVHSSSVFKQAGQV